MHKLFSALPTVWNDDHQQVQQYNTERNKLATVYLAVPLSTAPLNHTPTCYNGMFLKNFLLHRAAWVFTDEAWSPRNNSPGGSLCLGERVAICPMVPV